MTRFPAGQLLDRPILVVSTPRSGSTLLFETLVKAPNLHSVGGESHRLIEQFPRLSPSARGWDSNRLTAQDAVPEIVESLSRAFFDRLRDRNGRQAVGRVRMLEKTPKNALRVPFFAQAWPDSIFVYLYRDVRQTLSSMIEAWLSGKLCTYPHLPGWTGQPWSMLLVPGWEKLRGLPLPQIVAHQWAITTDALLADLARLPVERLRTLAYDDFIAAPQTRIQQLANALDLEWDIDVGRDLPYSMTTVSPPAADKWRRNEGVIDALLPIVAEADARARDFLQHLQG